VHPDVTHRDPVRHRDGAELERIAAGGVDAVLDRLGQSIKRQVARGDLVPAGRDADLRLGEIVVAHPDGAQHAAGGRGFEAVGHRPGARLDVGCRGTGLIGRGGGRIGGHGP
jgi:hypothetical protein